MPSKGTVRIFVDQADRAEYKRRAKACGLQDRHYLHFLMRGLDDAQEALSETKGYLEGQTEQTCGLLNETDRLRKQLAASEEARLLAEKVAFDNAESLWKAQQDAALWQSRAEQISQNSAAEVNDLSRRLSEAEEAKRRAESDADRWHAKWDAERGKRLSMTAWDHVRAAVRKRPAVCIIFAACLLSGWVASALKVGGVVRCAIGG